MLQLFTPLRCVGSAARQSASVARASMASPRSSRGTTRASFALRGRDYRPIITRMKQRVSAIVVLLLALVGYFRVTHAVAAVAASDAASDAADAARARAMRARGAFHDAKNRENQAQEDLLSAKKAIREAERSVAEAKMFADLKAKAHSDAISHAAHTYQVASRIRAGNTDAINDFRRALAFEGSPLDDFRIENVRSAADSKAKVSASNVPHAAVAAEEAEATYRDVALRAEAERHKREKTEAFYRDVALHAAAVCDKASADASAAYDDALRALVEYERVEVAPSAVKNEAFLFVAMVVSSVAAALYINRKSPTG